MDNLKSHIKNGKWLDLYANEERGHGLSFIYNLILWLVRDDAESLILTEDNIAWFRNGVQVGEFPINIPQPTPTFVELIDLVIERDNVVREYMQHTTNGPGSYTLQAE